MIKMKIIIILKKIKNTENGLKKSLKQAYMINK
jgi:hypothetical protein